MGYRWEQSQQNRITFVMVDAAGAEVPGLGGGYTLQLSKNGAAFAPSAGVKTEIGSGWYSYLSTAAEANTVGPVSIVVTGAGAVQQNLEYVVRQRNPNAVEWTYTVVTDGGVPIEGVEVWVSTDAAGNNIVWNGDTDALGVAMDNNGDKPWLDPGTYYAFRQKSGYTFTNPDAEIVV